MALSDVINQQWLRDRYLVGIDLTDDAGNAYPDAIFTHSILRAIDELEGDLGLSLKDVYTFADRHDVIADQGIAFYLDQVDTGPLREITSLEVGFGNFPSVTLPSDWYHIMSDEGRQYEIIPGPSSVESALFVGGDLTFAFVFQPYRQYTPGWLRPTYKAGFGGLKVGGDPTCNDTTNYDYPWTEEILAAIGLKASMLLLDTAGDLIVGAGIASQSVSIPGLSTNINTTSSATNAGYGARILSYDRQLKDIVQSLYAQYKPGMQMVVV